MKARIEQLVYGGSGICNLEDGKVIFVPFTMENETVTIENIRQKSNSFFGDAIDISNKNSERIDPPCEYFKICGGCQYQHISYPVQKNIKRKILVDQLKRLGGLSGVNVWDTVSSPAEFSYRNHVQFHLNAEGQIGFQKSLSHEIIPVNKCLILEDALNELMNSLMFEPGTQLSRVAIRDDGIGIPLLYLIGDTVNPPEFAIDFPLNVLYKGPAGEMALSGDGFNLFEISGKSFQVSAGSFFQTNREIASKMVELLLERIPDENEVIIDGYCGVGFFSSFLAERTERLIGIESSESACVDFAANLDQYDHVELYQGNFEEIMPELHVKPDVIVADPPRAGIAPKALKSMIAMEPERIVYISCDPSTLARDLKMLKNNGYDLNEVIPMDMFPQTYHIESMSILTRTQ